MIEMSSLLMLPNEKRGRAEATLLQGVQAVACTFAIIYGFAAVGMAGAIWALVSAVIVLRPGFEDSLKASQARIGANLVGALVGVAVGLTLGSGPMAVALALFLVILLCFRKPLRTAVRSACAGVVIVMMHEGSIRESGIERFLAVVVGCLIALAVGFVGDRLFQKIRTRFPHSEDHEPIKGADE
jgi:uncharacterized membrane protein YgaE (UPF0421/DUF939 family)